MTDTNDAHDSDSIDREKSDAYRRGHELVQQASEYLLVNDEERARECLREACNLLGVRPHQRGRESDERSMAAASDGGASGGKWAAADGAADRVDERHPMRERGGDDE